MRAHAVIHTSIWTTDFCKRSREAQHLYFLVLSQPQLTLCGVILFTPKRWTSMTAGLTIDDLESALAELEEHRYFLVDRDTEELLVRTLVRHDRVTRSPKTCAGMWSAFGAVTSDRLRRAILHELPDEAWKAAPKGFTLPLRPVGSQVRDTPSDRASTDTPCDGVSPSSGDSTSTSTSTLGTAATGGSRRTQGERKYRSDVPSEFPVTDHLRKWAETKGLTVDLERETEKFLNHHAATGKKNLDWNRAWYNWMLRAEEYATERRPAQRGEEFTLDAHGNRVMA